MTLYDSERDGHINEGETLLIFEDGKRKLVNTVKYFPKEIKENVEPRKPANKRNTQRSRPARTLKHRAAPTRRIASHKRLPLHKVKH